jgi:hypothetical protein
MTAVGFCNVVRQLSPVRHQRVVLVLPESEGLVDPRAKPVLMVVPGDERLFELRDRIARTIPALGLPHAVCAELRFFYKDWDDDDNRQITSLPSSSSVENKDWDNDKPPIRTSASTSAAPASVEIRSNCSSNANRNRAEASSAAETGHSLSVDTRKWASSNNSLPSGMRSKIQGWRSGPVPPGPVPVGEYAGCWGAWRVGDLGAHDAGEMLVVGVRRSVPVTLVFRGHAVSARFGFGIRLGSVVRLLARFQTNDVLIPDGCSYNYDEPLALPRDIANAAINLPGSGVGPFSPQHRVTIGDVAIAADWDGILPNRRSWCGSSIFERTYPDSEFVSRPHYFAGRVDWLGSAVGLVLQLGQPKNRRFCSDQICNGSVEHALNHHRGRTDSWRVSELVHMRTRRSLVSAINIGRRALADGTLCLDPEESRFGPPPRHAHTLASWASGIGPAFCGMPPANQEDDRMVDDLFDILHLSGGGGALYLNGIHYMKDVFAPNLSHYGSTLLIACYNANYRAVERLLDDPTVDLNEVVIESPVNSCFRYHPLRVLHGGLTAPMLALMDMTRLEHRPARLRVFHLLMTKAHALDFTLTELALLSEHVSDPGLKLHIEQSWSTAVDEIQSMRAAILISAANSGCLGSLVADVIHIIQSYLDIFIPPKQCARKRKIDDYDPATPPNNRHLEFNNRHLEFTLQSLTRNTFID